MTPELESNRRILESLMFLNRPVMDNPSICIKCRRCYSYWLSQYHKEEQLHREAILSQ